MISALGIRNHGVMQAVSACLKAFQENEKEHQG
jgi:hypothetical protein